MSWLEKRWYSSQPAPLFLRPFEALFKSIAAKKKRDDCQQKWQADLPVIVVGNITVGGTGKTPFITYLVALLKAAGLKPSIISRGYKSQAPYYPYPVDQATDPAECGDEPWMLYQRCQCPVVVDAVRANAAEYLQQNYECDLIISDDGLQHYKLGRDLEIVMIDGSRGLGNEHCLPAGPLRELPSRLDSIEFVVSNGPNVQLAAQYGAVTMKLVPTQFKQLGSGQCCAPDIFQADHLHAVAGIGHPQRFFDTLNSLLNIEMSCHPKPDHHVYTDTDFQFKQPGRVVMTEKDAVKAEKLALDDAWYLEVNAQLPAEFSQKLLARIEQLIQGKNPHG